MKIQVKNGINRYFAKKLSSVQILIYSNKPTPLKMFSILAISALLAVASADTVGYHPAPAPQPYLAPQPYAFTYGVSDSYSGSEYAAQAADDGKVVTGSYSVRIASLQCYIIVKSCKMFWIEIFYCNYYLRSYIRFISLMDVYRLSHIPQIM